MTQRKQPWSELVADLRVEGLPSLAWVVEYERHIARLWRASTEPEAMLDLIRIVRGPRAFFVAASALVLDAVPDARDYAGIWEWVDGVAEFAEDVAAWARGDASDEELHESLERCYPVDKDFDKPGLRGATYWLSVFLRYGVGNSLPFFVSRAKAAVTHRTGFESDAARRRIETAVTKRLVAVIRKAAKAPTLAELMATPRDGK